jgi:hypothetical protein
VKVISSESTVSFAIRTDNDTAKGLILGHADELKAELNAQNYQVGGLSVEVGTDSKGGTAFSFQEPADHAPGQHNGSPGENSTAQAALNPQTAAGKYVPRNSTISYRI